LDVGRFTPMNRRRLSVPGLRSFLVISGCEIVSGNHDDLIAVLRFLDAARGGRYMPPSELDQPILLIAMWGSFSLSQSASFPLNFSSAY
jgi:hypothetical protein